MGSMPGPGAYACDEGYDVRCGGFDGTGRLKLSRSMPAFSIQEKGSLAGRMGSTLQTPGPGAYFREPKTLPPMPG